MENVVARQYEFLESQEDADDACHHEHQRADEVTFLPHHHGQPDTENHGDKADDNLDAQDDILPLSLELDFLFVRHCRPVPVTVPSLPLWSNAVRPSQPRSAGNSRQVC